MHTSGNEASLAESQSGAAVFLTDMNEFYARSAVTLVCLLQEFGGHLAFQSIAVLMPSLFVIPKNAPTDCSVHTRKDEFHGEIVTLVLRNECSDVLLVTSEFTTQVGKQRIGSLLRRGCSLHAQHTDNRDRLLKFCAGNRSFLSTKNSRHSSRSIVHR